MENEMINLEIMHDNILSELDDRKESLEVIITQPKWLIDGALQWCKDQGHIEKIEMDKREVESGLPLIVPGTRYHINISKGCWEVLQEYVKLLTDAVVSNPFDFKNGAIKACVTTVISFANNVTKLSKQELKVVSSIIEVKKKKYKGMKKGVSIEELVFASEMQYSDLLKILRGLIQKNIVSYSSNRYKVIF